jgi:hypothetical protein
MKIRYVVDFLRSGQMGPAGYLKYMGPTRFRLFAVVQGGHMYCDIFEGEKLDTAKRAFFRNRAREALTKYL